MARMSRLTTSNKIVAVHDPNWDAFTHAAHASQLGSCNYNVHVHVPMHMYSSLTSLYTYVHVCANIHVRVMLSATCTSVTECITHSCTFTLCMYTCTCIYVQLGSCNHNVYAHMTSIYCTVHVMYFPTC